MVDKAAKVKFTYIPFKSGAEAAVQLAGGHINSHVNNPSESIGQWKGSTQRFAPSARSAFRRPEGHADAELARHPDLHLNPASTFRNSSNPARSGCRERSPRIKRRFMLI